MLTRISLVLIGGPMDSRPEVMIVGRMAWHDEIRGELFGHKLIFGLLAPDNLCWLKNTNYWVSAQLLVVVLDSLDDGYSATGQISLLKTWLPNLPLLVLDIEATRRAKEVLSEVHAPHAFCGSISDLGTKISEVVLATTQRRALVVDDSSTYRRLVKLALEEFGFVVSEAEDGQQALNIAQRTSFALVVTDQYMPFVDGITLTKALRARPDYERRPILILSDGDNDQMKQAGVAAGATVWLVKSHRFDQKWFIDVLHKIVRL